MGLRECRDPGREAEAALLAARLVEPRRATPAARAVADLRGHRPLAERGVLGRCIRPRRPRVRRRRLDLFRLRQLVLADVALPGVYGCSLHAARAGRRDPQRVARARGASDLGGAARVTRGPGRPWASHWSSGSGRRSTSCARTCKNEHIGLTTGGVSTTELRRQHRPDRDVDGDEQWRPRSTEKMPTCGGAFAEPSDGLEPSTPSLTMRSWPQLVARGSDGLQGQPAVLARSQSAYACPQLRPLGSTTAPYLRGGAAKRRLRRSRSRCWERSPAETDEALGALVQPLLSGVVNDRDAPMSAQVCVHAWTLARSASSLCRSSRSRGRPTRSGHATRRSRACPRMSAADC